MAIRGREHEVRGKIERKVGEMRERAGRALGDVAMQRRGREEQTRGTLRDRYGRIKRVFEE